MREPDIIELQWPSGQRRHPLRDKIQFSPDQVRAGRALMKLTVQQVAALAGHWPLEVYLTGEQVEAFEDGGQLDELAYAAICNVLYREGFGVISIEEGSGGEGVRFALPVEKRAAGTYADRRWRPVWAEYARRAEEIRAHHARMLALHGPGWTYNLAIPIEPISGLRTNRQLEADEAEGSRAP